MLIVKRLVGTTLIAAAVAIALLAYRSATGGRAQAEATMRAEADRQAALRQAELRAIEGKVQTAADLRALNAALGARVDSATMIDLLDNEDWWRPYREEFPLVRVIVGDTVVAARGGSGGVTVGADVVKAARRQMVASTQTTIGTASYLLAAARLPALSDDDAILLLGRPATGPAPGARRAGAARARAAAPLGDRRRGRARRRRPPGLGPRQAPRRARRRHHPHPRRHRPRGGRQPPRTRPPSSRSFTRRR